MLENQLSKNVLLRAPQVWFETGLMNWVGDFFSSSLFLQKQKF